MPKPPVDPVDVGLLTASPAACETSYTRDYALAEFARLGDSLAKPDGRAAAEFRFHTVVHSPPADVDGAASPIVGNAAGITLPALEGSVRARPWLVCQRCLNAYEHELESTFRIAFVATDDDTADVPEGYEGVAAPHGRAALAQLVEDELLLALPLVPLHATSAECAVQPEPTVPEGAAQAEIASKQTTQRPFADLRNLLGK